MSSDIFIVIPIVNPLRCLSAELPLRPFVHTTQILFQILDQLDKGWQKIWLLSSISTPSPVAGIAHVERSNEKPLDSCLWGNDYSGGALTISRDGKYVVSTVLGAR